MLHICSTLLQVLSYTSFSLNVYHYGSNNPFITNTYLDGTSNVSQEFTSSQYNLEYFYDYNYFNSRAELSDISYPLESHYVVTANWGIPSLSYNDWYKFTYGDSYSGTVIPLYDFIIRFNVPPSTSLGYYSHTFTISKIGNSTSNPRRDYYNAIIDITIIGYNVVTGDYHYYSANFNLSDTFKEGGYTAPFCSFYANSYADEEMPTQWLVIFDFHLQDKDGYADYYENLATETAYQDGYETGYAVGEQDGYGIGHLDGFAEGQGSHYSFKNLFGVLIDTPIIYLRKMFDYELFGISVFKALATVISLIVALSVFRLVRGIF